MWTLGLHVLAVVLCVLVWVHHSDGQSLCIDQTDGGLCGPVGNWALLHVYCIRDDFDINAKDCSNLGDGDYPHCFDCCKYVSCCGHVASQDRSCPAGGTPEQGWPEFNDKFDMCGNPPSKTCKNDHLYINPGVAAPADCPAAPTVVNFPIGSITIHVSGVQSYTNTQVETLQYCWGTCPPETPPCQNWNGL